MRMLEAGVGIATISLYLGHENPSTAGIYLHADLAIKQQALDRTRPPNTDPGVYQPPDHILAFFTTL
jgi:integrase